MTPFVNCISFKSRLTLSNVGILYKFLFGFDFCIFRGIVNDSMEIILVVYPMDVDKQIQVIQSKNQTNICSRT
jgi:hypothetical protein